jgi:hypothetical protein
MKSTYSVLVQSRFFNASFNSAIFDGPLRIYFSQFYESWALKLYFAVQEQLSDLLSQAKSTTAGTDENVLLMLYPNQEAFQLSFEGQTTTIATDRLESDTVVGVAGVTDDEQIAHVVAAVARALQQMLDAGSRTAPHEVAQL